MEHNYYFDKIDILLVDDRKENLLSLEAILMCPDYNLIKVNSGAEALRHLLKHTPALILMDVQMPNLSGFETAAVIKGNERTREIPIIFVTAISKDEHFVHEGYEHGAIDYIYKPFDAHILKSKVAVLANIRRQQRRISRLVAVQRAATEALAEATNVSDGISKILKALCTSLGWDLGIFWRVDKQAGLLCYHAEWHNPENSAPVYLSESFKLRFSLGDDHPGRVWADRKSLWVTDVVKDPKFARMMAATQENIHTVVGIPISVRDETMGVLEVCSRKKLAEDPDLMNIMGAIGSQIGQVLKQAEAFELVRASESLLSFLVDTSMTLSSSLDYEETLKSVANLAVKSLADWCVIDVKEEGDAPRTVAVAHIDPARRSLADQLNKKHPPDWSAFLGAPHVIRTGTSEIYPTISDELLMRSAKDEEHLKMMRDLGLSSAMIVPVTIRGKTWGTITFVAAESTRFYAKEDLTVAEELARRASMAIENAKLYRDAQDAICARDELFSIASHELKTPITSLKILLQLTQRGINLERDIPLPPEKLAKMLDTSSKQVDQLTHLVEDLLDVVNIRAGKLTYNLKELNLSEMIRELAERYSTALSSAKCLLELEIEPGVVGVCDPNRIEQVFVNLISNAIKYAAGAPVKIKLNKESGTVKIVVQDSGPGIAPEQQIKIFDRFERAVSPRNISGLGLGLFIVKQIVEAHGGLIRIDSEIGKGSSFIVELPIKPLIVENQNGELQESRPRPEISF